MKNKLQKNLLTTNKNINNLQNKDVDKSSHNSNKGELSFSRIIGSSGWGAITASDPSGISRSSDKTSNNVLVASYNFVFDNVELNESELKNLDFIIETQTNPDIRPKALKQWSTKRYLLMSDGYKIYAPSVVWEGGKPGFTTEEATVAEYKKPAWNASYVFQSVSKSGDLRSISGYYSYVDGVSGDNHTINYWMHSFTSVSHTEATGIAYFVDYNDTLSVYDDWGFDLAFNVVYADTTRTYGAINTWASSLSNIFRLDRYDRLDSGVDFTAEQHPLNYRAYYDSYYFWPIVYDSTLDYLTELPNNDDNIYTGLSSLNYNTFHHPSIPSDLYLTIGENVYIESSDIIGSSGVTATGRSFFYVKKPNGKYEVRIIGGIVYETDITEGDDTIFNTRKQNYNSGGREWTYDSTVITSTLATPYYRPLAQGVQMRCLLNYNPLVQYKDFESK